MLVELSGLRLFGEHYGVGGFPDVRAQGGGKIDVVGKLREKVGDGGDLFERKAVINVGGDPIRTRGLSRRESLDQVP